jgi:hypothetical protein
VRIARNLAALVALATVGFAVGDFASHPNALGAIGIMVVIAAFAFLLAYLYRPQGASKKKAPRPPRERKPQAPKASHVWAEGWDADEARAARERRQERPRG